MKRLFFFVLMGGIFFSGCSTKINPADFGHVNAPKSKFQPSANELHSKMQIMLIPFSGNYQLAQIATSEMKNILVNYPAVSVLNRRFTSVADEIKLAEEAKATNSNLQQADYLIKGKITAFSTNSIYHKAKYWKDRKGKIHTIPSYYENRACVSGIVNIVKIPENEVKKTLFFKDCESKSTDYRLHNFNSLLQRAVKEGIDDKRDFLYDFFAKKGYVYEIRKKDDTTILHTTIGKNDGVKSGLEVYIYTVKEKHVPFSNKTVKESVVIGKGEISNVVNSDNSWIIVDKVKEPVKIGDYVKPVYNSSFFEKLKNLF